MNFLTVKTGVVIPSFKEKDNIQALIQEIIKFVPNSEIVVVDDSPDQETVSAVKALKLSNVSVIHRTTKGGRGSAVLEGIKSLLQKDCQAIVELDADFSHPPSQIPELLAHRDKENIDLLIASRYLSQSSIRNWPLTRRIFSKLSNLLARSMLRVPISDYTNGFRVYSHPAAKVIVETCGKLGKGFISLSEILVNTYYRGMKVSEVPTVFTNRLRGESSVSSTEIKNAIVGLIKIFYLKRRLIRTNV